MKAPIVTEEKVNDIFLPFKVSKIDAEKRLVTGVATDETFDRQGEITDYETAKKLFTNPDAWPGNIREMHQPKAVGKAIEVECNDDTREIAITARISKGAPDTWEKVQDGTLSMFSIGGSGKRVIEKVDGKPIKRLFLEQLAEVSLVDNGANPSAKFQIVKSVDGKMVDAQPEEPAEETPAVKAVKAVDEALAEVTKVADKTEGKEYAEPKDIVKAARALGRAKGQDRNALKANIIASAYKLGADYVEQLPESWKNKEDQKSEKMVVKGFFAAGSKFRVAKGMEPWDINQILSLIMGIESLITSEVFDAYCAAQNGDATEEVAQVKLLKAAAELMMEFLQSEWDEQFNDSESPYSLGLGDDDDATVEMFAKALTVVVKAGARHSKSDNEMVQKIHDLSGSLGAACKDMSDEGATKMEKVTKQEEKKDEKTQESGDVSKLQGVIDAQNVVIEEQKGIVAKQAETISLFETRLKALEDQPRSGGPAKTEVSKTLGGPAPEPTANGHENVLKAFDTLAAAAVTEEQKSDVAMKKLNYLRAHGLNTLNAVSGERV